MGGSSWVYSGGKSRRENDNHQKVLETCTKLQSRTRERVIGEDAEMDSYFRCMETMVHARVLIISLAYTWDMCCFCGVIVPVPGFGKG